MINYLEGGWIDHIDPVGPDFGHIHSLQGLTDGLTKVTNRTPRYTSWSDQQRQAFPPRN